MDELKNRQKELASKKQDILWQLEKVNREQKANLQEIYNLCEKITGHNIIYEREEGPYGEMFRYCTFCGLEY